MEKGDRVWVEAPNMANDDGVHFPVVGELFADTSTVRTGRVGDANSVFFATRQLVDFAESYFARVLS